MRRARKIGVLALVAVIAAATCVVAFSAELRAALLFQLAPRFASRRYLVRFEDAEGRTVTLLGTIHTDHLDKPDYSLWHLAAVVERLSPDLLLVESRPEELARDNWCDGPIEMGFASLVARSRGTEVRGMDYWQKSVGGTIVRSSEPREDEMFRRTVEHAASKRAILVLTGFSHVAGFSSRLRQRGFRDVEISPDEKARLLSREGRKEVYPEGFAACLERRIAEDTRELERESDAEWRVAIARNLAVRRRVLGAVGVGAPR